MEESTDLPKIDYTARDFNRITAALQDYVSSTRPELWNSFFGSDLGEALIELVAYVGDVVMYQQDKTANNLYWDTMERLRAAIGMSKLLAYVPQGPVGSGLYVTLDTDQLVALAGTLSAGDVLSFKSSSLGSGEVDSADSISIDGLTYEVVPAYVDVITGDIVEQSFEYDGSAWVWSDGLQRNYVSVLLREGVSRLTSLTSASQEAQTLAFQTFQTELGSVIQDSWQVYVNGVLWAPATNNSLLFHNGTDKVYSYEYTDDFKLKITFGDDATGKVPSANSNISIIYRVGGGTTGNIFADVVDSTLPGYYSNPSPNSTNFSVTNKAIGDISPIPDGSTYDEDNQFFSTDGKGFGGSSSETLENIRYWAPRWFKVIDRAITTQDFDTLANLYPGNGELSIWKAVHERPIGEDDVFLPSQGITVNVNYPSQMANIVKVYAWVLHPSSNLPVPPSTLGVLGNKFLVDMQNYFNLGNIRNGNFQLDVQMAGVQTFVVDGVNVPVTVNVSSVRVDPVFSQNTIKMQITDAVKAIFAAQRPGVALEEMKFWRSISMIDGILGFTVSLSVLSGDYPTSSPVPSAGVYDLTSGAIQARIQDLFVLKSLTVGIL